jgi:DNA-binding GntR family transcriptional regulator
VLHENRRVSVPCLTRAQLDELAFLRLAVEPELARLALGRMSGTDIDRLAALDGAIDSAIGRGDVPGYLRGNYRFHFAIHDLAQAPILCATAQSLWLRFGPSLRVVVDSGGQGPDMHKDALAAMRSGDPAALEAAIRADIAQGISRMATGLAQG